MSEVQSEVVVFVVRVGSGVVVVMMMVVAAAAVLLWSCDRLCYCVVEVVVVV